LQTNQNIILTVHMSILLQLGKATRVRTNHTMVRRKGTLRQVMVHKTLHRTWTIQKLSSRPARQLMCSWRVKSPFYFYFYFYFYQNAATINSLIILPLFWMRMQKKKKKKKKKSIPSVNFPITTFVHKKNCKNIGL
jgi:hypothetical protein